MHGLLWRLIGHGREAKDLSSIGIGDTYTMIRL